MSSIAHDEANIPRRRKANCSLNVCRSRSVNSIPHVVAKLTRAFSRLKGIAALVRKEWSHYRRRGLVANILLIISCVHWHMDVLDLFILPLALQALTSSIVECRAVAGRSKRYRCNEPPAYCLIEAAPFRLRRPCYVSRKCPALTRCLATGDSNAQQCASKQRETHRDYRWPSRVLS